MLVRDNIVNIFFLLLLGPMQLSGQVVTGKIIDIDDRIPVEFATAYINGTTNGTMSDKNGTFKLTGVKFPCEIVISHLSYNPFIISLDCYQTRDLLISLSQKVIEINEITIVNQNLRDDNIQRFRNGLLGTDDWGKEAILLNDSVLKFYVINYEDSSQDSSLTKKAKLFRVTASAPLRIDLPLLGYELQYDLVNYVEKYFPELGMYVMSILGYSYFKEKLTGSKRAEKRYRKNRMEAYFFSTQHFTRSLYENRLPENGYKVYKCIEEKDKVSYVDFYIDSCDCLTYTKGGAMITELNGQHFKMIYYGNARGYPVNIKNSVENFGFVRSASFHILTDTCLIRANGSRPGNSILFDENIGTKRIGAALPDDYIPEYH